MKKFYTYEEYTDYLNTVEWDKITFYNAKSLSTIGYRLLRDGAFLNRPRLRPENCALCLKGESEAGDIGDHKCKHCPVGLAGHKLCYRTPYSEACKAETLQEFMVKCGEIAQFLYGEEVVKKCREMDTPCNITLFLKEILKSIGKEAGKEVGISEERLESWVSKCRTPSYGDAISSLVAAFEWRDDDFWKWSYVYEWLLNKQKG